MLELFGIAKNLSLSNGISCKTLNKKTKRENPLCSQAYRAPNLPYLTLPLVEHVRQNYKKSRHRTWYACTCVQRRLAPLYCLDESVHSLVVLDRRDGSIYGLGHGLIGCKPLQSLNKPVHCPVIAGRKDGIWADSA